MKLTPITLALAMTLSAPLASANNVSNLTLGQSIQRAKIEQMNSMYDNMSKIQEELATANEMRNRAIRETGGIKIVVDYGEVSTSLGGSVAGLTYLAKVIQTAYPENEIMKNLKNGKLVNVAFYVGLGAVVTGVMAQVGGNYHLTIAQKDWDRYSADYERAQEKYAKTQAQFIEMGKGLGMTLQGNVLMFEGDTPEYLGNVRPFILSGGSAE
ncbi:MAG: hypothetical protein KDD61_17430 [Bdellovibrionales bacterium]|nr:hypothetical protein [Bdellovibrionales bacterium]